MITEKRADPIQSEEAYKTVEEKAEAQKLRTQEGVVSTPISCSGSICRQDAQIKAMMKVTHTGTS